MAPLRKRPRQLPFPLNLYQTAVGKKWVMAVTGLGLIGFVIAHMVGNLKVYLGPEEINQYGEALRDLGGHLIPRTYALWALRIGLVVMFALHIHSAVTLSAMSNKANQSYPGGRHYVAASYASRTMRWTGPIILLYLFYHLADLTWGWWLGDDFVRGDPYHNLSESLASLPVAIIYVVAQRRPGRPPVPWHLVDVPEPRHQQPALELPAPGCRRRRGRADPRGEPELPDPGSGRRDRRGQPHLHTGSDRSRRGDAMSRTPRATASEKAKEQS